MISTFLTTSWGLQHPIIQAPMFGHSGSKLVAAVATGGALGMLGVGSATATDWIAAEAEAARPHGCFGIGLMNWALDRRPELLEASIDQRPFAISLSFGDPAPYAERVRRAGIKVMSQVQDSDTARQALDAGVDLIVAQGMEAGGHTGTVGTLPLLQIVLEMADKASVPVLAAGGIATGVGIAGVLAMGAAGVWMGTRFAATQEGLAPPEAKARLLRASETDTVQTHVFDLVQRTPWPDQFPGRALANDFASRWHGREEELRARLDEVSAGYAAAREPANYDQLVIYGGQAVGLVHDLPTASELVHTLMAEAESTLRRQCAEMLT